MQEHLANLRSILELAITKLAELEGEINILAIPKTATKWLDDLSGNMAGYYESKMFNGEIIIVKKKSQLSDVWNLTEINSMLAAEGIFAVININDRVWYESNEQTISHIKTLSTVCKYVVCSFNERTHLYVMELTNMVFIRQGSIEKINVIIPNWNRGEHHQ